jgi:hypothetical protein
VSTKAHNDCSQAILDDLARGARPIPLAELPQHPSIPRRNGRKAHIRAGFRWASRGLRGRDGVSVRLEVARACNVLVTTDEGIRRWLHRLSGLTPTSCSPRERARHLERVDRELAAAGI